MKTDKELYPVFDVDICTQDFAMEGLLVGAVDVDDLIEHLPELLKKLGKPYQERRQIIKNVKTYNPEAIKDVYTDNPYTPLSIYGYCE